MRERRRLAWWQAGLVGLAVGGAAVGTAALLARRGRSTSPRGKGVFVRSLVADTPTPASMVDVARDLGLGWVALAGEEPSGQVSTIYPDRLPAYADALHRAGVQVWLWGWPVSTSSADVDAFVQQLGGLARQLDAEGVIVNAERPFYDFDGSPEPAAIEAARRIVDGLHAYGVPVGLTSYGSGPVWHPGFAWAGFEGVDFGMPQIYDTLHRLPRDYPSDAIAAWQRAGFDVNVPLLGASFNHTPEQMRDILARTPVPNGAVGWWTLDHALNSRGRTAVIRDAQIGRAYA